MVLKKRFCQESVFFWLIKYDVTFTTTLFDNYYIKDFRFLLNTNGVVLGN